MSTTTESIRKITFDDLHGSVLGTLATWEEVIPLIEQAQSVQITFEIVRNGVPSAGSLSVDRSTMLQRARDGIRWAAENSERQQVRINGTRGGTLWIG